MNGSSWTLLAAGVGTAVFLMSAVSKAVPSGAASSTQAVNSVLGTIAPFAGATLGVAAVFAILALAVKPPSL